MRKSAPFRLQMAARNSMRMGLGCGRASNKLRLGISALMMCVMLGALLVTLRGSSNPINSSLRLAMKQNRKYPGHYGKRSKDQNNRCLCADKKIGSHEGAEPENWQNKIHHAG